MPVSSAKWAFGTTLGIGAVLIAEVKRIGGPSQRADTIDVSSHDSPNQFREFIAGLKDGGEISIEGSFIVGSAGQVALNTNLQDGSIDTYVLTFPAAMATTWTFDALVTALNTDAPHDAAATFTATLKVTGKPTLGITPSTGMATLTGIEENTGAALTFVPAFSISKFTYVVSINTASTWVKFLPTAAAHTITILYSGLSVPVVSGNLTGALAVVDGVVTTFIIRVQETGCAPKDYTVYVGTPL